MVLHISQAMECIFRVFQRKRCIFRVFQGNGRNFADDVFKCIFLNKNVWISLMISLKFVPNVRINNIPALVQIMAWCRSGDKPLSESIMVSRLTHIYVTQPQRVNNICISSIHLLCFWFFLVWLFWVSFLVFFLNPIAELSRKCWRDLWRVKSECTLGQKQYRTSDFAMDISTSFHNAYHSWVFEKCDAIGNVCIYIINIKCLAGHCFINCRFQS